VWKVIGNLSYNGRNQRLNFGIFERSSYDNKTSAMSNHFVYKLNVTGFLACGNVSISFRIVSVTPQDVP